MQRRLSYRVTKPDSVSWKGLKAAWRNDKTFRAVDKRTAEILFVRHVTKLQMAEAEKRKTEAAEVRLVLRFRVAVQHASRRHAHEHWTCHAPISDQVRLQDVQS